jgi:DNA-directed RNA polymerase specialized sigma24 family protein
VPPLLDPSASPRTGPSARPDVAAAHQPRARSGEGRPLRVLDRSFRLLVCDPAPLTLDGAAVGHGLPARPVSLEELRTLLLHPSMSFAARDAALTWLIARAQAEGGAWLVGLAGVLLPGIGRRVYPLCRAYPRLAHDLEAEALAGLLQAVKGWSCGKDRVATRLVWAAARASHKLLRRELAVAEREAAVGLELDAPARPAIRGELVLDEAVAAGVVSQRDAELIAATRLEDVPVRELGERWGVGYEALRKRRQRAEASLADWLREQDVSPDEYGGRA